MSVWKEFREFAARGNVVDLATGVIVGTAFSKIVTSLTQDILMPPIGVVLGKVDFANLFISLSTKHYRTLAEAKAAGVATINYGLFLNNVLDFLITAFAVFLMIKQFNRLKRHKEASPAAPDTRECPYCIAKIPVKASRCPQCTSQVEPV